MFYHIDTEERSAGGRSDTVYVLRHFDDSARAEVWPAHGFNCLRWQVRGPQGLADALYASPEWEHDSVPTRSGVPVLFPFPNRIRDGRYRFGGKAYQLPLNDPTRKNAIHGWAPRHPWRVAGYGCDEESAWVHGEFRPSVDAPEVLALWPADYILSVTHRLVKGRLRIESRVQNPSDGPLPFGLGFHPYFRFPLGEGTAADWWLEAPARSVWELSENLPTGTKLPVTADEDWNHPRLLGERVIDAVYTDLGGPEEAAGELVLRGQVGHRTEKGAVQVWSSRDFRELVVFTPPHRRAVCLEPYTCTTDAINLSGRGVDAGWRELPPGGEWAGAVEFRWEPGVRPALMG